MLTELKKKGDGAHLSASSALSGTTAYHDTFIT